MWAKSQNLGFKKKKGLTLWYSPFAYVLLFHLNFMFKALQSPKPELSKLD